MTGADDDLDLLKTAAREAAEIALRYFRKDSQVWWKEGNSPVGEADLAVDRYLRERLLSARPGYGWLSEETAPAQSAQPRDGRFFVVDPIDGTRAFLRGDADWCVSLAVIEDERPLAGVVDAPIHGEVLSATARGPSFLNGEALALPASPGEGPLRLAVVEGVRKQLVLPAGLEIAFTRHVPSLAYRLCLVAAGRLDATLVRPRANDWDIAAADLILERAGGRLYSRDGRPPHYRMGGRRHGLLIAGPSWADELLTGLAADLPD